MEEDTWADENAMKYLHLAMKAPYPMISFVTGACEAEIGSKHKFNSADLGTIFVSLFSSGYWNRK